MPRVRSSPPDGFRMHRLSLIASRFQPSKSTPRLQRSASMRLRVPMWLLLFSLPACLLSAQAKSNAQKFSPSKRTFHFTYNFTVKDIPAGAKQVRVWIPVPQTDPHQAVRVIAVTAPSKTQLTNEPEYGNRMIYAEMQNPASGKAEFTLEYEVTRREYSRGDYAQLERKSRDKDKDQKPRAMSVSMNRLVAPDNLIPIDGKIKALAVDVTGSQTGTIAKAKAAYDYLFTNMRYEKTGS